MIEPDSGVQSLASKSIPSWILELKFPLHLRLQMQ